MPSIFSSNGSARSSKRTTPRGPGNLFLATTTQQQQHQQQRSESSSTFSPEKTGDSISPSHTTTTVTLNSMEVSNKPPTGRVSPSILDQKPESMVAETLRMKGELEFSRLLRVDGRFEGELITNKGSLVVGPKGEVIGDLKNMQEVYVEGIVRGNVCATEVKIKKNGMLLGDIQCTCLTLDPTASIKGVADTATMKERALLEANPPPPSSSSTSTTSATPAATTTAAVAAPAAAAPAAPATPPAKTPAAVEDTSSAERTTSATTTTSSDAVVAAGVAAATGKVNEEDVIPAPSPSS